MEGVEEERGRPFYTFSPFHNLSGGGSVQGCAGWERVGESLTANPLNWNNLAIGRLIYYGIRFDAVSSMESLG